MPTRFTILCENTVGHPFRVIGEHGFACYIETGRGRYLFDTGQGFGILQNAQALGADLAAVDAVMISHGHYDHVGGLPDVLRARGPVDVHAHPEIFIPRYWSDGRTRRFIGIPHRREYLEALGARFRFSADMTEVGPGLHLTGEVPRRTDFERSDPHLIACPADADPVQPDPIRDDISLVVETDRGLVLVLGCAHSGMVNIIEHVLARFGRDRLHAVIGGTHLGFADDAQFEATLAAIDRYRIDRVGVSHCTGQANAARLHARLGERFFFGCVGAVLEV